MRKIFLTTIIALIALIAGKVNAQELVNYNLYMQHYYLVNPAYALDKNNCFNVYLNTHQQWMGFEGSPKSYSLGAHGPVSKSSGVGINLVSRQNGILSNFMGTLSYAYRMNFADAHNLAFGVSLGILNDQLATDLINGQVDVNDPDLANDTYKKTTFLGSFGLAYNFKGIEAQVILPQLLERNTLNLYTIGILAYNYKITDDLTVKPSIMTRGAKITPFQFQGNVMVDYKDLVWGQFGYRTTNSMIVSVGLNLKGIGIGYAYQMDNKTSNINSTGTHEIQLVYKFGCKDVNAVEEVSKISVKGTVVDKETKKPMTAKVVITDAKGNEVFNKEVNGAFNIILETGKYTAVITGNDVITKKETFVVKDNGNKTFELQIQVKEVKNKTFELGSVNFETGKATIKGQESYDVLDKLVQIMTEYNDVNVEIGGHTDDVGDEAANLKLSQERADACKTYVISKGIDVSRIKATGYGETKPIVPNDTPENKAKNRRTEFKIVD
jgi:type IX secretion system PorP/SprF family membrane protein